MKSEKLNAKIEFFICNHKREDGKDCTTKGGKELADELKKWAKENKELGIKVYRSGCLGKCEEGIACLQYPEKNLLTEVKKSDGGKIKEGLIKAL